MAWDMGKASAWRCTAAEAGTGHQDSEQRQALGRALHGLGALALIAATWPWRDGAFGSLWLAPLLALGYAAFGALHFLALRRNPGAWSRVPCWSLLADPAAFAVLLCDAPTATAFLAPYAVLLTVPVGLRRGMTAFRLAWLGLAATMPPLLYFGHPFWASQPHLVGALAFTALLLAAFFGPLHARLHAQHRREMEESKQQALEAAMVAKSAFLARVSHQLRSPLQAIVSSLELMEAPSQQAMRPQLVGNISACASKLSMELRDLLTIARAEAWQLHLEPSAFDAGMLLESVAADLTATADNRDRKIYKVVPQEPVFVVADSDKIVQVLTNVARHVLGTMRPQSLTLAVKTGALERGSVTFVVRGDQPSQAMAGAAETAAAALAAMGRAGAKRPRDELSDSLSLSLVRTLVDFLGGTIEVGGDLANPREFSVTIPCEMVRDDEGRDGAENVGALPRVLLVTENAQARADVPAPLGCMQFTVERVSSVPVAANRLALRKYALVLVDLGLPRHNGKRLAAGLKNGNGINRDTPVVSFNGRPVADDGGEGWPFDAAIAGALTETKLVAVTSSLWPAILRH